MLVRYTAAPLTGLAASTGGALAPCGICGTVLSVALTERTARLPIPSTSATSFGTGSAPVSQTVANAAHAKTIQTNAPKSHRQPRRGRRVTPPAIGTPQWGHCTALSETLRAHSLHATIAMAHHRLVRQKRNPTRIGTNFI